MLVQYLLYAFMANGFFSYVHAQPLDKAGIDNSFSIAHRASQPRVTQKRTEDTKAPGMEGNKLVARQIFGNGEVFDFMGVSFVIQQVFEYPSGPSVTSDVVSTIADAAKTMWNEHHQEITALQGGQEVGIVEVIDPLLTWAKGSYISIIVSAALNHCVANGLNAVAFDIFSDLAGEVIGDFSVGSHVAT